MVHGMSDDTRPEETEETPVAPRVPIDRLLWPRSWAQLKFFAFQPAIFPRLTGQVYYTSAYRLLLARDLAQFYSP